MTFEQQNVSFWMMKKQYSVQENVIANLFVLDAFELNKSKI